MLQAKSLGLANGGPGDPDSAAGFLSQVRRVHPWITFYSTSVKLLERVDISSGNDSPGSGKGMRTGNKFEAEMLQLLLMFFVMLLFSVLPTSKKYPFSPITHDTLISLW